VRHTLPPFLALSYFAPSNMTVTPPRADQGDDGAERKICTQSMAEMTLLDGCRRLSPMLRTLDVRRKSAEGIVVAILKSL
jgi:hypothetical protein